MRRGCCSSPSSLIVLAAFPSVREEGGLYAGYGGEEGKGAAVELSEVGRGVVGGEGLSKWRTEEKSLGGGEDEDRGFGGGRSSERLEMETPDHLGRLRVETLYDDGRNEGHFPRWHRSYVSRGSCAWMGTGYAV